jgi:transposase
MPKKTKKTRRRKRKARRPADVFGGLATLNANAAGIDIGAESHWVAVPADRDEQPAREFAAFTADLYELADWLQACGVDTVVMESTGVYWINLFEILEERGFQTLLVDPHNLKSVPGRQTDLLACQWLQKLHTFGLLSGAFRPANEICELRGYVRQRSMLVQDLSRIIQHMQKALTQMNVKLQHVLKDITGKTGLAIIRSILEGERDPVVLAQHRDPRCKNSEDTIAKALKGHWRPEHLFALEQAVQLYDTHREMVRACDEKIQACLGTFEDRAVGQEPTRRPGKPQGNECTFDATSMLLHMTGVDLTEVPGIQALSGLKLVSEIGLDMTRWPTVDHFCSWLTLCPGNKTSGGKLLSSRTRPSANRAAAILRVAAQGLWRSDTPIGRFHRRMRYRLSAPQAVTATAHKLARIIYTMLRTGRGYVEPDSEALRERQRQRREAKLKRQAREMGFKLLPA